MAAIFDIVDKELFVEFGADEKNPKTRQKPYGLRFTQMAQLPCQKESQSDQNKTESQVKDRTGSRRLHRPGGGL